LKIGTGLGTEKLKLELEQRSLKTQMGTSVGKHKIHVKKDQYRDKKTYSHAINMS